MSVRNLFVAAVLVDLSLYTSILSHSICWWQWRCSCNAVISGSELFIMSHCIVYWLCCDVPSLRATFVPPVTNSVALLLTCSGFLEACASISLHDWGDTQWPINPTRHYCPPLIHLHSSPPPERCKVSQQVWNSHELNLNLRFTLLWPSWLDYRVPTTPCTSRLKTKKTKNSFNLSRKYCMDKK